MQKYPNEDLLHRNFCLNDKRKNGTLYFHRQLDTKVKSPTSIYSNVLVFS